MKGFILYRIATYIFLFIAGFFAISLFLYLPVAFAQPSLLLVCFLFVCKILYSYTSYRFMSRGMIGQMTFKKSFKDLIRVNAYGALVLAVLILSNCIFLINQPQILDEQIDVLTNSNNMDIDPEVIASAMKKVFIALAIYAGILIIHIFTTLRLVKKYAYLFDEQA